MGRNGQMRMHRALGFAHGVTQFSEASGIEVVWMHPELSAFAIRKPLSNELQFCCPKENTDEVMKLWAEMNAGSGSRV